MGVRNEWMVSLLLRGFPLLDQLRSTRDPFYPDGSMDRGSHSLAFNINNNIISIGSQVIEPVTVQLSTHQSNLYPYHNCPKSGGVASIFHNKQVLANDRII